MAIGFPAGSDTFRGTEAHGSFSFSHADSGSAADVVHEIGIWTFIPVGVRLLLRGYRITGLDEHGNEITVLEGDRLDRAALELAQLVSFSRTVTRVRSGDCCSAREALARELVAVTCWVQPAVAVQVQIEG